MGRQRLVVTKWRPGGLLWDVAGKLQTRLRVISSSGAATPVSVKGIRTWQSAHGFEYVQKTLWRRNPGTANIRDSVPLHMWIVQIYGETVVRLLCGCHWVVTRWRVDDSWEYYRAFSQRLTNWILTTLAFWLRSSVVSVLIWRHRLHSWLSNFYRPSDVMTLLLHYWLESSGDSSFFRGLFSLLVFSSRIIWCTNWKSANGICFRIVGPAFTWINISSINEINSKLVSG